MKWLDYFGSLSMRFMMMLVMLALWLTVFAGVGWLAVWAIKGLVMAIGGFWA